MLAASDRKYFSQPQTASIRRRNHFTAAELLGDWARGERETTSRFVNSSPDTWPEIDGLGQLWDIVSGAASHLV